MRSNFNFHEGNARKSKTCAGQKHKRKRILKTTSGRHDIRGRGTSKKQGILKTTPGRHDIRRFRWRRGHARNRLEGYVGLCDDFFQDSRMRNVYVTNMYVLLWEDAAMANTSSKLVFSNSGVWSRDTHSLLTWVLPVDLHSGSQNILDAAAGSSIETCLNSCIHCQISCHFWILQYSKDQTFKTLERRNSQTMIIARNSMSMFNARISIKPVKGF